MGSGGTRARIRLLDAGGPRPPRQLLAEDRVFGLRPDDLLLGPFTRQHPQITVRPGVIADLEQRIGHQLQGALRITPQPFAPGKEGRRDLFLAQDIDDRTVVPGGIVGPLAQIEGQRDDLGTALRFDPADRPIERRRQAVRFTRRRRLRRRAVGGPPAGDPRFLRSAGERVRRPQPGEDGRRTDRNIREVRQHRGRAWCRIRRRLAVSGDETDDRDTGEDGQHPASADEARSWRRRRFSTAEAATKSQLISRPHAPNKTPAGGWSFHRSRRQTTHGSRAHRGG